MAKRSFGVVGMVTDFAAVAAIGIIASSVAARAAEPPASSCLFKLAENPRACARLIHAGAPRSRSWISATAGKTLLYASEPFISTVSIMSVGPNALTPSGQLAFNGALPLTLAVDSSKNLYVSVFKVSGSPSVEVFAPGSITPSKVYTDGIVGPIDLAVDSHGTLYVANVSGSGICNVVEYAKGSMKPTAAITDLPGCPDGVATDLDSNLYVSYTYYPPTGPWQTDVVKFARGSTKGARLHLKAPGLNYFYGIAVDSKGDLVVANSQEVGAISQILIFPHGSHTATGVVQYSDGWSPLYFALDGDRLFAPAYLEQGTTSLLTIGDEPAEFEYPSGSERLVENPKLAAPGFFFAFAISG